MGFFSKNSKTSSKGYSSLGDFEEAKIVWSELLDKGAEEMNDEEWGKEWGKLSRRPKDMDELRAELTKAQTMFGLYTVDPGTGSLKNTTKTNTLLESVLKGNCTHKNI
ncbi:hypothetical protein P7C73_g6086, partial [Tremellales sp. Uapishka_1]